MGYWISRGRTLPRLNREALIMRSWGMLIRLVLVLAIVAVIAVIALRGGG